MKDERAVLLPICSEKQVFSKWIWLTIIAAINIPFIISNIHHDLLFILGSLFPSLCVSVLFLLCKLTTELDPDGFHYKYFPFHLNWHLVEKEDIAKIYVRKYSPLKEFGGWGIRGVFPAKAYIVKGNMGIQFELKDGRKVLFGTQKPEEWEKVIKEMFADSKVLE